MQTNEVDRFPCRVMFSVQRMLSRQRSLLWWWSVNIGTGATGVVLRGADDEVDDVPASRGNSWMSTTASLRSKNDGNTVSCALTAESLTGQRTAHLDDSTRLGASRWQIDWYGRWHKNCRPVDTGVADASTCTSATALFRYNSYGAVFKWEVTRPRWMTPYAALPAIS